jgi:hypothetical protein
VIPPLEIPLKPIVELNVHGARENKIAIDLLVTDEVCYSADIRSFELGYLCCSLSPIFVCECRDQGI